MTTCFDLMFNPPGDIAAMREKTHDRDMAVYGLLGGVRAIVEGAKFRSVLPDEYRLQQLADLLAKTEAKMAAAEAKYEAAMAAWRAQAIAEDSIPV